KLSRMRFRSMTIAWPASAGKATRSHRARRSMLSRLEDRVLPSGILVVGAGRGAPPEIRVYDAATGTELFQFLAYGARFRGGVSVAVGDVSGDGSQEIITAPGPGIRPEVKVWSASGSLIGHFFPTSASYRGGLSLATGDVLGMGNDDIVTANARGLSRVSV